MDDVWVLHDDSAGQVAQSKAWMDALDAEWQRIGIESHPSKVIDAQVLGEIQGAQADDERPSLGVGPTKLVLPMMAIVDLALQWKPQRKMVERIVGKAGHVLEFGTH